MRNGPARGRPVPHVTHPRDAGDVPRVLLAMQEVDEAEEEEGGAQPAAPEPAVSGWASVDVEAPRHRHERWT